MKQKKTAPAKKKTISEEAKELGLTYIGNNKYSNKDGKITHFAVLGKLYEVVEDKIVK